MIRVDKRLILNWINNVMNSEMRYILEQVRKCWLW